MISTMSFSIGRHYCMGVMISESFITTVDPCEMIVDDHCEDSHNEVNANCCETKQIVFDGIDVLSFTKQVIDLDIPFISDFYIPVFYNLQSYDLPEAKANSPPLILSGRTILVLQQRFLI